MRYFTGSQWSSFKSVVTWSRFDCFKMSRAALFWIFCMRAICSSATHAKEALLLQSWRDHRRNKLFCGTVREERTYRSDSPECKKRSAAEATDVLFHWQCLVKMHSKVSNGGLKRNATATYICRLAADRTDPHWWTYKHHLSFFCVKLQFVALHPWQSIAYTGLNIGLSRSEIARWCTVRDFCVISVLLIVTAVTGYDIRQGLWIQGE